MATFVLIHGAWHGAWCWFKVAPLLRQMGHTVRVPDLPAHGIDRSPTSGVTLQAYADRVCAVLDACAEPAILVGHSMGGIVISEAAEARPDKVARLVYLTAFLLRDGETLLEVAQTDAAARVLGSVEFSADGTTAMVRDAAIAEVFYNDCSAADIELARTLLVPQAAAPFATPARNTAAKFGRIPRHYIECVADNAISIATQRAMHGRTPCSNVVTLDTGHSPFFSAPDQLVHALTAH